MNKIQTHNWYETYIPRLAASALYGFLILMVSIFTIAAIELRLPYLPCLGIFIWGVSTTIIFNLEDSFYKTCTNKFVHTDVDTTYKVVLSVLKSKNIPFEITDNGINLDTIEIRIDKGSLIRGKTTQALISIGPCRGSNRPLVESLTKKIDEAFLPQGLNHL